MKSGSVAGAASSSSVSPATSRASGGTADLVGVVSLLVYRIAYYMAV